MYTSTAVSLIILVVLASVSDVLATDQYECLPLTTDITTKEGVLSIKRDKIACAFQVTLPGLFAIQTDELLLYPDEKLTIRPKEISDKPRDITGLQNPGYIVIGFEQPKLEFILRKTNPGDSILLKFFQNVTQLPIPGDTKNELVFQSLGIDALDLSVQHSISDTVYLRTIGLIGDTQHLLNKNESDVKIKQVKDSFTVEVTPVLNNCSGIYKVDKEESLEISGPKASTIEGMERYKCAYIFKTSMDGLAHFDVDFGNFLGLVDRVDELSISDGSQSLSINSANYKQYTALVPNIVFSGKDLAITYESPAKVDRLAIPFKLTVHSKASGGVVDTIGNKLQLPTSGSAYYSLRIPANRTGNVALNFDGFGGASVALYNLRGDVINLPSAINATIPLNWQDDKIVKISRDPKNKISGTITYQSSQECDGTLFGSSGTIWIPKGNRTCRWFLGASENVIKVHLNDLRPGGYLKITDVKKGEVIFYQKNLSPANVLPTFVIDSQVYLEVLLDNMNSFLASVSPVVNTTLVSTSALTQSNITSIGYPFYYWSTISEAHSFNFTNKEVVLSVADLDLRLKENITIGEQPLSGNAPVDFSFKNKTVKFEIARAISQDFTARRGYKLVTSEFQAIMLADVKKNVLKTPKNLTSLLVRVPAGTGKRLLYNITFAKSDPDYVMEVFDSASLMGRQVENTEKFNGSTTSNTLLVSVRSTKSKVYLPELTVNYVVLACNTTSDHVCDGSARCVPANKMCKGVSYCADGSDLKVPCASGPAPPAKLIENGVSGVTVFILSVLMFTIGAITALYGPDLYKNFEARYRSGHYTTFQSADS